MHSSQAVCLCIDVTVTGYINRTDKATQSSSILKEDEECGTRLTIKWEALDPGLCHCEMRMYS